MSGKDGGYILPLVIDPPTISLCIEIPDDTYHIAAFWHALDTLTWSKNWQRDPEHKAAQVSRVWERLIEEANDRFNAGQGCGEVLGERCETYGWQSPVVTFYPEVDATDLPLGYAVNSWVKITGDNPLVGLKAGDIMTDILHMPALPSIWDHLDDIGTILALGYPSVSITDLEGTGTIRIHLVSVLLGGRAITVKDNNLLTTAFLDTNLDSASLPPETYAEIVLEYVFDTVGTHRLDVVFVPNVSADIEFLGYGGAFRKVEICGFGREGCNDMSEECCDSLATRLDRIISLIEGGFFIQPLLGASNPPDTGAQSCAPDYFDHDTGEVDEPTLEQRKKALCITVDRYVKAIFNLALAEMNGSSGLIDFINDQFPQNVLAPLLKLKVVYPSLFSGLNAFFDVVTNNEDLTLIACAMVDGLQGDNQNTYVNFKGSLTSTDGSVASLVSAANQVKNNFVLFNEALEMAYHEDLSEYACPCGIGTDCEEPLDLIIHAGRGISITHVSGTLYHFVGDPSVGETGGMYVEDSLGRCMDWWNSDDEEHPTQTVPYHAVTGCCGTPDSEGLIGGFAGLTEGTKFFTLVYWDQQSEPVDTYYNVKCKDSSACE